MGRAEDRERAWRASSGSAGSPDADQGDVIEMGDREPRWNWPRWLGPRWPARTLGVGLAVLVVGLLLGYAGGHLQASHKRTPAPAASQAVTTEPLLDTTGITVTGARCAVQLGSTLQLGIEIVNQSTRPVTLHQVAPVVPLSGMQAVAARWGPCGSLPEPVPQQSVLKPGATIWLAVTFRVLVKCPEPFPVLFKVSYAQSGRTMTTQFDSFPDLGQVKYNNCRTGP
ncbi:MAG TPA: hypothetical protein VGJ50_15530 [Streptosporangiaceae bacterium]